MKKLMKHGYKALALLLAVCLTLSLSVSGFAALAVTDTAQSQQNTAGGVDVAEVMRILLTETDAMDGYVNKPFYYVPNTESHYVALGDDTVAGSNSNTTTYADLLADKLGVTYRKIAGRKLAIQDVYTMIADNRAELEKADLISIGWSIFSATTRMFDHMTAKNPVKVSEAQWRELVGEENMQYVHDILDLMFQKLSEYDLSAYDIDFDGALEWCAYVYMCNTLHQSRVIEAIRQINPNAVIVLVGTYNDLKGPSLKLNGEDMNLATVMEKFVNASNLLSSRNAERYSRVAYVHAPEVITQASSDAKVYTDPLSYLAAFTAKKGLPTDEGHAYIAGQIQSTMEDACTHIWDEGVTVSEPTCGQVGQLLHTCGWCGETKTEAIAATGDHVFGDWINVSDTVQERQCQNCDHKEQKTEEPSDVLLGDVNNDGRINARDARALLRHIAGLDDSNAVNEEAADFNKDGRVNARDARALLRHIAGLE